MPLFIRKFIVDFVETGIAAIFALTIAFPTDVASARQMVVAVGFALLAALVSAARRAYPSFVEWLRMRLGANGG